MQTFLSEELKEAGPLQLVVIVLRPNNPLRTLKKILKSNQGFTLLEILIALLLIIIIMALALSDPFSTSADLDKQSNDIERAVRFMGDEAALRNSVVRLHFMLNKAPQEYAVEYGPNSSFILPPESEFETTTQSKEDEAKADKKMKEVNLKFNKVQEFQESNTEVHESVKILGIGNGSSTKLKKTGEVSIYAFPSGEKDDAIVILGNEEAIISLAISPFNQKIERKIQKVEAVGTRDINEVLDEKAKEIFDTWLKDK